MTSPTGILVRKTMKPMPSVRLACAALLLASLCADAAQSTWPPMPIPKGVVAFDLGEQLSINGLALRMRGLVSSANPSAVAALFRQDLGQPLVENTLASKRILGRALGEYYVTVQLEPSGTGTRGVMAMTKLGNANRQSEEYRKTGQLALARLPAGSTLVSRVDSVDNARRSTVEVFTNTYSTAINDDYLRNALRSDGYVLERQTDSANSAGMHRLPAAREGTTLFFKRPAGEATAVIYRNASGRTDIVLNTIAYPGGAQ